MSPCPRVRQPRRSARPAPRLVLLVGDEELLSDRAISAVAAAPDAPTRQSSRPSGPARRSRGRTAQLLGPSLFGDARYCHPRPQDIRTAAAAVLGPYLDSAADGTVVVLQQRAGPRARGCSTAPPSKGPEISCAKLTRPDERADFVRAEIAARWSHSPDAVALLLDAVGSDLRELAAVAGQLVSDSGEMSTRPRPRLPPRPAEVTALPSRLAVVGRSGPRWRPALRAVRGSSARRIADALATACGRSRGSGRPGGASEYELAKRLGMPPWKVKRGWAGPRLDRGRTASGPRVVAT